MRAESAFAAAPARSERSTADKFGRAKSAARRPASWPWRSIIRRMENSNSSAPGLTASEIKASQAPTSASAAATGADTEGRRAMADCTKASAVAAQSTSSASDNNGERGARNRQAARSAQALLPRAPLPRDHCKEKHAQASPRPLPVPPEKHSLPNPGIFEPPWYPNPKSHCKISFREHGKLRLTAPCPGTAVRPCNYGRIQ